MVMKKKGLTIKINFSNRWLYSLITLGIILVLAAGIYALTAGTTPNPGHAISEMGVPSNCVAASALMWDGSSLVCGNNYLWKQRYFPPWSAPEENTRSIQTKMVDIGGWNMDSAAQLTVDYGSDISWDKVVRVSAIIYSDTDASNPRSVSFEQGGTWALGSISTTKLVLTRTAGGTFDNADFDYAYSGVIRGRVVIDYYA